MVADAVGIIAAVDCAVAPVRYARQRARQVFGLLWVSVPIAGCWMAALAINNSRSHRIIGAGAEEYRRVWLGTLLEIARGYPMIALPTGLLLLSVVTSRGVV